MIIRDFSRAGLEAFGFTGFAPFALLPSEPIPMVGGVYVVLRDTDQPPVFLPESSAGTHKGKSPTVVVSKLERKWVSSTRVVYIGKAKSLQGRLTKYRRQGRGSKAGHFGGRYIWQLSDWSELLVAWCPTDRVPKDVEDELIAAFVAIYKRLPFANLPPGGDR